MTTSISSTARDWLMTAVGFAIAAALFFGRGGGARPDALLPFVITVVPSDAQGLDCSSATSVGYERCAFDGHGQPLPIERPLRPFVTTGGELVLLADVFEQEHVAAWLAGARRQGAASRVTLDCQGKLVGLSGAVRVRFADANPWEPQRDLSVGRIESCVVR